MCCQLCQSDELWEHLYCVHNDSRAITDELRAHAKRVGWRSVFFANKLQLQVPLTLLQLSFMKVNLQSVKGRFLLST